MDIISVRLLTDDVLPVVKVGIIITARLFTAKGKSEQ
jgi:hypothetical protein